MFYNQALGPQRRNGLVSAERDLYAAGGDDLLGLRKFAQISGADLDAVAGASHLDVRVPCFPIDLGNLQRLFGHFSRAAGPEHGPAATSAKKPRSPWESAAL